MAMNDKQHMDLNDKLGEIVKLMRSHVKNYDTLKAENAERGEALQLIRDIGYDYDGFEKVESLKSLIDELVGIASQALKGGSDGDKG